MATVSDTLLTILKMQGAAQYQAQMLQAAQSVTKLAEAQGKAATVAKSLASAFGTAVGGGAAIAAGVKLIKDSVQAFAESEQATFRATVVLRNLGNTYPIEKAQAFASALQMTTAADDEAVVGTLALLKQFGVANKQLEGLTTTVLDFSAATGIDLKQATELVGRASLGQTRGLKALGIQIREAGTQGQRLVNIQRELNGLFGGAAAAQTNTLTGSLTRLSQAWGNVLETAGSVASRLVPLINGLADALNRLSNNRIASGALIGGLGLGAISGGVGLIAGGPAGGLAGLLGGGLLGALLGGGLGAGAAPKNAAEQIGSGRSQTQSTLDDIARNTGRTADAMSPFIRKIIGGTGEVALRTLTLRDAVSAFGI